MNALSHNLVNERSVARCSSTIGLLVSTCRVGQLVTVAVDLEPDGRAMATRLLSRCFPGEPGIRNIPVRGFVNQVGLILEPVARGMGFTVLPQYARQAFGRHGEITVIKLERDVVDSLWMISRAEWPLSARARYAMEYLKQQLKDR